MSDLVLVDTCVWASFFGKPASAERAAVDLLIDSNRVALIGPVIAETLIGFRRNDQAAWAASRLRDAELIEILWDDWTAAAALGREMIAGGHRLPLTDLILATISCRRGIVVYTTDPHFDLVVGMKRFQP